MKRLGIGAQHLSSKNAFIRNRLLTFSPRLHRQGSRIRREPSSLASRPIILPAHECGIPFWEPYRAASIPPAHRFPPSSKESSDARDHHTTPRNSERRAPAGAGHQRRRYPGWRRAINDLCRDKFWSASRTQGQKADNRSRHRSASLARLASQLRRGRPVMSRAERIDGPPPRTRNNRSVGSAAVVQSV